MSRDSFIHRDRRHGPVGYRRAARQEQQLAARLQGRRVPRSGAGAQKGDVRVPGALRLECKTTTRASFTVTRAMVTAIETAALPHGELPVLVIEFLDVTGQPVQEVAVVPTYCLEFLR